jgi:FKBP-type peptidyl-prolyl cis-trans isomerase SlyD
MAIQKNDFIELEFTGIANGEIFDTTNTEEASKINPNANVKPAIISVGNQMLLKGFDDSLIGKEIGKEYLVHLKPEEAFGKRDSSLIKTVSIKIFREKNMNPVPGMTVQLDQYLAKILSVSGGRVIVDFNNYLAGKEVDYNFKILRKVDDNKEKVDSIQEFFFRKKFDYELKDNSVIFNEPRIKPLVDIFKDKFKEITGLDFVVEEKKEKKEETNNIEKNEVEKENISKESSKSSETIVSQKATNELENQVLNLGQEKKDKE